MAGALIRSALRRSLSRTRHVSPVRPSAAVGLVADVYREVERDFGLLAPPIALHSPSPTVLAASWVLLRETLLAAGLVDRTAKEAVAAAVSLSNTCPYCVEVHSTTLRGLGAGTTGEAIAADRLAEVDDDRLGRIAEWARTAGTAPEPPGHPVPFPASHGPELIGVAVAFHYVNRVVNVFLDESALPGTSPGLRAGLGRMLSRYLGATAGGRCEPGRSLPLLPRAPLAPDLSWAAGARSTADALARAAAEMDRAGVRSVPEPVRALVVAELTAWRGEPRGLSRAWALDRVADLPRTARPAGLLALLVAFSSYQVDTSVVAGLRRHGADDATIVDVVAWASFAAARRVGSWMNDGIDVSRDPADRSGARTQRQGRAGSTNDRDAH
ncbi:MULTISPECIES: carboxymuconolactone decarboxylase family protein [Actinoalloteichus]|uniref:Alkylhydroperoxidase AhpD family core domain n=1 Tax=Actinoalloteichus fjordicus TaxID=1612552 RepID=A0AAC9PSP0_9PSEU|nr:MULTISPECIES: carboxymuconolactone decarboxylase family protein [Actinoalloteichus]APU15754.1 alkylhydroperoxidase AhpD family core domain [Actinoalloteichus fjordicus]APU21814.1 alkylhydroperoxidase AhpD family core domain [Actinoalloteichus sp. GBA129-24]